MVLARHTQPCSSSAQGRRSGWRLCGKIEHGFKATFIIVCNFHGLGINIYGIKGHYLPGILLRNLFGKINFSVLINHGRCIEIGYISVLRPGTWKINVSVSMGTDPRNSITGTMYKLVVSFATDLLLLWKRHPVLSEYRPKWTRCPSETAPPGNIISFSCSDIILIELYRLLIPNTS